jgi:hypothetical protein
LGALGKSNATIAVTCNSPLNYTVSLNSIASLDSTKSNLSSGILATSPYTNAVIFLRLTMDFIASKGTVLYSADGRSWAQLGGQFNIAYDWLTGTFQGEQYAIFCYNPQPGAGFVDVDYFRMEPPPLIAEIKSGGSPGVTLSFENSPNSTNVVQSSSNLGSAAAWQNLSTNKANGSGLWQFTDTNANSISSRFYRTFDQKPVN